MHKLFPPSPWSLYTPRMIGKLETLRSAGHFTPEDATARRMFLARGKKVGEQEHYIEFYLLVDEEDGIIADIKYLTLSDSMTLALIECSLPLALGKTYEQLSRLTLELLYKNVAEEGFSLEEFTISLTLIRDALHLAARTCAHIPLALPPTPLPEGSSGDHVYPEWLTLTKAQKLALISSVMDTEVRPYVELDEGGVEILDLVNDRELLIAYQGACTTCYSAVGSTLTAIQQILRDKVHPELLVTPNL